MGEAEQYLWGDSFARGPASPAVAGHPNGHVQSGRLPGADQQDRGQRQAEVDLQIPAGSLSRGSATRLLLTEAGGGIDEKGSGAERGIGPRSTADRGSSKGRRGGESRAEGSGGGRGALRPARENPR